MSEGATRPGTVAEPVGPGLPPPSPVAGGPTLRVRGSRALSVVLPGLPQLLAGRWGAGGAALLLWIGLLAVVGTRVSDGS